MQDFRRDQGKQYELGHVLFFAVLAVLSGADSYRKIATFFEKKLHVYEKEFGGKWKKCPSYSTIRNIIKGTFSLELEEVFRKYAGELSVNLSTDGEQVSIAFDGKVIRGSFDHFKDQKAIQFLSLFCNNSNLILAHEEIECKTNEIPVAQKVIEEQKTPKVIYTCDALSCQTATLEAVTKAGSEIIAQVKGNQKHLLNRCKEIATRDNCIEKHEEPYSKAHGRIESRTVEIFSAGKLDLKWSEAALVIKVNRERLVFDTRADKWDDTGEVSFFISTSELSAEEANKIIRGHWGIENKNHHVRDRAMKEDESRIRVNPQNIARLRSFALNIMRYNGVTNISNELYANALDFNSLLMYKGL